MCRKPVIALLAGCAYAAPATGSDGFATAVVSYVPGTSPAPGYANPASALGAPAAFTAAPWDGGVVSPFQPAWLPGQVVSIGAGGSLVLELDAPATDDPRNPYGIDIIVFGNSFFTDISGGAGTCGSLAADGGLVDVSADGITWCHASGVQADGLFPTLGYIDAAPFDAVPGAVPADPRRPVSPAHAATIVAGATWLELIAAYDGSAGGAGIDLSGSGCASARFVRIRVPAPPHAHVEIDAVSRVRPVGPRADLDGDGDVDGIDLTVLLVQYGAGGTADLNGDGVVDGNDLTHMLAEWTG